MHAKLPLSSLGYPTLKIRVDRRKNGQVAVRAEGELDVATGPWLERTVRWFASDGSPVALDLAWITFVDCAGLRSLRGLLATRDARLVRASPALDRVVMLTAAPRPSVAPRGTGGASRLAA